MNDEHARYRVTDHVTATAAIRAKLANIQPVVRLCLVCDEKLPAGIVRHPQCRGWNV